MKKFTLFLVAITMSLFSFAAQPKRIYAYDLSSALVDKVYTFSFTANETPTSGKIIFYDATSGELVGEIALTNPVLGKNEVEIAEYSLPGNDGQQLNWAVELSAAEVTAFEAVYTGAKKYGRGHAAIDNSPESNYFGRVYVTDRRKTDSNGGLYVYTPSLQLVGNDVYKLGRSRNGYSRPAVAADGTLFLADYTDAERSGIYVVDPSDLTTCTQFYDGTRASSGLFTNTNGEEIGSSTSGVGVFGSGANMVLYTMMEDGSNPSAAVSYHIGQPDGSILKSWSNVPTWICKGFASINASTNNAFAATEKGVWISQNDAVAVGSRTELVFIDKNGTLQFQQDKQMCKGAGLAVNADNSKLYISGSNNIVEYNITWNGNKPTLELSETHSISYAQVSTLSLDYAGNLIACVGASYGSTDSNVMLLVQYTLPTTNNTCEVPAKKADVVTKVEAAVTLYTITTNVNDLTMGSVSGNLGTYEDGAPAELTAVANEHYEFVNWTGDVTSTDNPLIITVDGDKNITANFAKKQYTLTVFVNDENKGTIDVATGSHEYGTEVILTATPKTGYKLLAWSNKATTSSITLTMDNNKAVSAYFVKEYATDPTFTIEKVWENTNVPAATANGLQGVGWDQKIYIKDRLGAAINVYTETGSELYAQLGATVTGLAGDQPIAVDDAGNLVVRSGSTNFYDSPTQVSIFRKNENTPEVIDFTLPATGRCDFISASGDIFSEKGGYVYFFCMNQTTVSRLHIKNGEYEGVDTIAIVAEEGKAASQSHVVVDIYGNIHTSSKGKNAYEYNITTLTTTADSYLGAATKKTPKSTIGGCTFELGGKELWAYVAGTTNYSSEWELKNVTDGVLVSNDVLYAKDKTTVNSNPVANWLNVQVVDEKTAYIYQFCPTVAAAVWKVTMKENYLVSATATNGTVSGAGTYQEEATATLTATPNTGYKFVNWTKGGETITDNPYTFTVSNNVALVANFEAITSKDPRAWAYDMKLGEEDDNYTFTFKATTAGQATISFKDKDGNALAQPESQTMTAVVGENKFTIAKNAFAAGVDAFWAITMDGAPIEGVVEVTDQTRGIYDFYNMMGVVVDNNTDSKDFGKIYVQQSYQRSYATSEAKNNGITTRSNEQTSGIFIYNQDLDELNNPSNVGYKPTMPSGYTEIGSSSSAFQRLNIHPKTGNLVFSHAIAGKPSVFAINRDDMTGAVTNLLTGVADMTRSVAHCFDAEGKLYVMDFADSKGAVYEVVNGNANRITEISSKFINAQITMASDGRGGLWISQNRGQMDGAPYYYQLVHVSSNGEFDWAVNKETPHGFEGSSSRGALAYDAERNILAQGRNGKVELYTVTYEPTIKLTPLHTIASDDLGNNIDGLAFDYAGDLYVVNSSKEKFQKFTLPTDENICTVAAPALEAIRFTPVYTVSVESNNNEWGIANGGGTFEEGETATITAVAATNYEFVNWTKGGVEVSTEATYSFPVTESATYIANFKEITKYTIDATANNPAMGTVEGAGTYYEGTEVTLTATAKGGYVFVKWSDEVTDESRTFTAGVDMPETLTANFKVAVPRAWAYDLRLDSVADPANYIFTFKTTSAGSATLIFKDEDGNIQNFGTHTATATEAGEQTITIAKTVFVAATKDIYWEVELAGDAIAKMAEITNPARNIYDFYNMMGVVVDNDPNSDEFGKIYIQQSYNGADDGIADRSDTQKAGIFIYNQALEELNAPANTGIKPQLPYTIGANRQVFKRITINPSNGDIAFCNNTTTDGGAYVVSRENLAGEAINLTKHISEIQKVNALCFDDEGNLYVVANVSTSATPNGNIYQIKTDGTHTELTLNGVNLFYDPEIAMAYDGRGGLWIAQNRWGTAAGTLFHVNVAENKIDFKVEAGKDYSDWFAGANYRGAIAYDKQRNILAVHSQARASVFQVTYAADGVPSIAKICQTPNLGRNELDGLAFDYAGDLYVVHSGTERFYKYVLPTNTNTCTVPAPKSQVIQKETRYTVTVAANDDAMGTVAGGGTEFLSGDAVTVTAVANTNYEFVNWTENDVEVSTSADYTFNIERSRELVANFQIEPLKIKGIVKRAVQIGESTVVLTHEADGTPHIYKLVNGALEAEISQVGVVARDPENAGDLLSISDIAATEDGKLVAINKIVCQSDDSQVAAGYKRGETRVYKWDDLASDPSVWFTSKQPSNFYKSIQGHTMAYKGTSTNGTLFTTGVTAVGVKFRYSVYNVIDGIYTEPDGNNSDYYHYVKGDAQTTTLLGQNYELNASPLAINNWILDGGLVEPFEITDPIVSAQEVQVQGNLPENALGKSFNGATYFSIAGAHFMVAPYADASGNVAGVKLMHITDGLAAAKVLKELDLPDPETATAAATAVLVDEVDNANGQVFNNVTITLITDAKVHTLTTELDIYVRDIVSGNYGTVCLPNNAIDYCGASLYEVAGKENGMLYFDEIATMEAGEPYLLLAEQSKLIVVYGTESVGSPSTSGVMKGTFEDIVDDGTILKGNYMIYNNTLRLCGDGCWLNAYRAYFGKSELDALGKPMAPMPGRRRISMGGAGDNQTTALENITEGSGAITPIIEGTYDVLGRELSEPNATGFYIINGKKVVTIK